MATAVNSFLPLNFSTCGLETGVVMACVADWTACSCCLATANSVGGVGGTAFKGCLLVGDLCTGDFVFGEAATTNNKVTLFL